MIWEPFEEIERMRRRMERLMRTFWWELPFTEEFRESLVESFPVDIVETDDELVVRADLPGFNKEEVAIRASEDRVEIVAKHKEERIEKGERIFKAERRVGAARRFLTLPTEVDVETAKTSFKNGVLEIRFKKKKPAKKLREIKIE